jgi:hypothetical protein
MIPEVKKHKWLLLAGVLAEAAILLICYWGYKESPAEVFRHAARYSGRLSFVVYVYCVYSFIQESQLKATAITGFNALLFLVLHFIHLGFLLTSLYLNKIHIPLPRLAGGFIAYVMILLYPFVFSKLKSALHLLYYYYVGLIMLLTFAARASGKFEGAASGPFHYAGMAVTAGLFVWLAAAYRRRMV